MLKPSIQATFFSENYVQRQQNVITQQTLNSIITLLDRLRNFHSLCVIFLKAARQTFTLLVEIHDHFLFKFTRGTCSLQLPMTVFCNFDLILWLVSAMLLNKPVLLTHQKSPEFARKKVNISTKTRRMREIANITNKKHRPISWPNWNTKIQGLGIKFCVDSYLYDTSYLD